MLTLPIKKKWFDMIKGMEEKELIRITKQIESAGYKVICNTDFEEFLDELLKTIKQRDDLQQENKALKEQRDKIREYFMETFKLKYVFNSVHEVNLINVIVKDVYDILSILEEGNK